MIMQSKQSEANAVIAVAELMTAAARTAPKTKGQDYLQTCILTGDDLQRLAAAMEDIAQEYGHAFISRDAKNVQSSAAVVALGISHNVRGLNEACGFCKSKNCAQCVSDNNSCVYDPIDLGIAVGSAVSVANAHHIDNRVMFSVGLGLKKLGVFDASVEMVLGIPLCVSGKSPFFDR